MIYRICSSCDGKGYGNFATGGNASCFTCGGTGKILKEDNKDILIDGDPRIIASHYLSYDDRNVRHMAMFITGTLGITREECQAIMRALDHQFQDRENELAYKAIDKISRFAEGK